jgi:GTP cyclohydrolase I
MYDVQSQRDDRQMPIDKVGVCDLQYPIVVLDRKNLQQSTTAKLSMSVNLPHEFKGTHMSRFIEVLNTHRGLGGHANPAIEGQLKTGHRETA